MGAMDLETRRASWLDVWGRAEAGRCSVSSVTGRLTADKPAATRARRRSLPAGPAHQQKEGLQRPPGASRSGSHLQDGLVPPLGGESKAVEAGRDVHRWKAAKKVRQAVAHKRAVLALVERGGNVRTFHINRTPSAIVGKIVLDNIRCESAR